MSSAKSLREAIGVLYEEYPKPLMHGAMHFMYLDSLVIKDSYTVEQVKFPWSIIRFSPWPDSLKPNLSPLGKSWY